MKKKNTDVVIKGFGKARPPEDEADAPNSTDAETADAVNTLYSPAEHITFADELITPIDLYEEISQICDTTLPQLFAVMKSLNFKASNIDGKLMWPVKYNT